MAKRKKNDKYRLLQSICMNFHLWSNLDTFLNHDYGFNHCAALIYTAGNQPSLSKICPPITQTPAQTFSKIHLYQQVTDQSLTSETWYSVSNILTHKQSLTSAIGFQNWLLSWKITNSGLRTLTDICIDSHRWSVAADTEKHKQLRMDRGVLISTSINNI